MSEIDYLLYRPIKEAGQFNGLFPKSTCKKSFSGDGMTDFSVTEMHEMVKEYHGQTAKVAPLLKKSSLKATCKAIHDFCFNYFQYKADTDKQMLRSPACSWHSRHDGIDCKSYSIIASCILTNLGISHYIRRVKQPGFLPHLWTHVYIIVPADQATGKLTKGHYTIDGTMKEDIEPMYTEKSDIFLNMEHYRLNAPAPQYRIVANLGSNSDHIAMATHINNQMGLGISISDIKNMFSGGWSPSCIGGSLNANNFNQTMANVVPAFDDMIYLINDAIRNEDNTLIAKINKILRVSAQIKSHAELKAGGDWKSACSQDAVNAYRDLGVYYNNIVKTVFVNWLKHYFDVTFSSETGPNNTFDINIAFDKGSDVATISYLKVTSIKPKSTTTEVKRFELTPYAIDHKNLGSGFNLTTFLQGLTSVLVTFKGTTGGGSGSGTGTGGTVDNLDPITGKPYNSGNTLLTAGGGILGFVIFAAGAALIFKGMKDKPATATKTTSKKSA